MGVKITKKATEPTGASQSAPEVQELPREGLHLRATPWERQKAHAYSGNMSGPLCNTGNGHAEATYLARHVTCPCCIAYIVDRLHLPNYLTKAQWEIIGRDMPEGLPAPGEEKAQLQERNINVGQAKPVSRKARATGTAKPKPSVYDEF